MPPWSYTPTFPDSRIVTVRLRFTARRRLVHGRSAGLLPERRAVALDTALAPRRIA